MITGIGTDIVHIDRVQRVLDKFGERFVNRILTPEERVRFDRTKGKANHLAKRFAAKEAFSKAIGTGIRSPFRWHSITVGRDSKGKPVLKPDVKMAEYLAKNGVTSFHVSLTDDPPLAALLAEFGVTLALRASEGPRDRGGRPASTQPPATWLGAQWAQTGELRLTTVYRDGPAAHAGLSAQDVLVAIDGLKATGDMLGATLGRATPGTRIGVDAFRRDVLHHFEVELTAAPLDTAYLAPTADAPDDVVERRRAWLGG